MVLNGLFRQWLVVLAFAVTLLINSLANSLALNGRTTGEVSNSFLVYFKPAGFIFAIWGLIYMLLTIFVAYQAFPSRRNREDLNALSGWFVLSCIANGLWLVSWHFLQFELSQVIMFILLFSLVRIYLLLYKQRDAASTVEKFALHLPFRIYTAWVCVAAIANFTVLLADFGVNPDAMWGFSGERWAVLLLFVGAVVALAVALPRTDWVFLAVFMWAYFGIAKQFPATTELAPFAWAFVWGFGGLICAIFVFERYFNKKHDKASA